MMTKKLSWDQYFQNAISSSRKGIFYINEEIKGLIESDPIGFYQYTKCSAYKSKEFKCGQSSVNVLERISQQREASEREQYLIVGFQPSKLALIDSEDQKILRQMHEDEKCFLAHVLDPTRSAKEWAIFEDTNPAELWFDYLQNNIEKRDLRLTIWQMESLDNLISLFELGKTKIMAELAARFGKTLLYLSLFDYLDRQVMVVGSYYLTALSSFKKEVYLYKQFSNFSVLDLSSDQFEEDFMKNLSEKKKILVVASLCGDKEGETVRNSNAEVIENYADKITVIDEADYGAHTDSCVPFVNQIGKNAPIILTTGTNSQRAKSSHNDVDAFFKVTYLDMLMKAGTNVKLENSINYKRATEFEKNLTQVKFYRYDWSKFAHSLNDDNQDLNPSFSKSSQDVQKSKAFWSGIYKSFIGESDDVNANDFALDNCLEDDSTRSVMQFVSMTNKQLKNLEKIAKSIIGDYFDVHCISGDIVKGKDAEQYVKDAIRIAKKNNKEVWIIASQMCQRSFSIPDINVVILAYDNGDMGATLQKISRSLTTGNMEKIGHIISLSIDGNRDDKIAPMIMDAAKQVSEHDNVDFMVALRRVMKTLPIFQMSDTGYNIALDVDEYSKEIFSSNNSQRVIINSDRLMYDGCLDIISNSDEIEKITTNSSFKKGQTFIDPRNTKRSMTSEERSILTERRNKLTNILDRTAYCVEEIRKNRDIDFKIFVELIQTNHFIAKSIGATPEQFLMLIEEKYIDESLFSMYIECVK